MKFQSALLVPVIWSSTFALASGSSPISDTQSMTHTQFNHSMGLAERPPMGWNSWNSFGCAINEKLIKQHADIMASIGLAQIGYQYIIVDDCWQGQRSADGTLQADPKTFPSGMKVLADYVHARGLKFGLATDAGMQTCAGRPGSYNFEKADALTFAAWGVDFVKVGWCHTNIPIPGGGSFALDPHTQYTKFRDALRATGRPMVLSINNWGVSSPWDWGPQTGQMWRTTRGISPTWASITSIIDENSNYATSAGPGRWNDPDMLEVGVYAPTGQPMMNETEFRSHFSMWAMMAAPLIAGNDMANMPNTIFNILGNPEVIAVDQDPLGIQGMPVRVTGMTSVDANGNPTRQFETQVWSKPLAQPNAHAVALFNRSSSPKNIAVYWRDIGLGNGAASVRDLWARADQGVFANGVTTTVAPHAVVLIKVVGEAPAAPRGTAYVSDLPFTFALNGFGPVERDMSVGDSVPGLERQLSIAGIRFMKGLGVHARSDVRLNLGGNCTGFFALAGVDGEAGNNGSVIFKVYADGRPVFESTPVAGGAAPLKIALNMDRVQELRLVVDSNGADRNYDHATWGDAKLSCYR